jgi:hypothetical protein
MRTTLSATALRLLAQRLVADAGGRAPEAEILSALAAEGGLERAERVLSEERSAARIVRVIKGGETVLVLPEDQRAAA